MNCISNKRFGLFKKLHPGHRKQEIENSIRKAVQYFEDIQMPDGSCIFRFNYYVCSRNSTIFFVFITSIVEHEIYMEEHLLRYGNWGICFTFGTWFALRGLAAAGKTHHNCLAVRKAADFLLKLKLDDGGWGESYLSCLAKVKTKFSYIFLCAQVQCVRDRRL